MTETEALADALDQWRSWARHMSGQQMIPGERWSDEDLRAMVIYEQEQRAIRLLNALRLYPEITEEQRKQAVNA